jgi:toxin ParE1/3/4
MTLDFTPAAISDLQSIRAYTLEHWGTRQEQLYLDSLWAKFETIRNQPNKYRTRNDLFPGCQIAAQARHVILFRIHGTTLQIVRILHNSMDFPRHIPDALDSLLKPKIQ